MGVLTRRLIKQNLDQVDVLVNDTNNDFFAVQDLPETFTQGRNTFKIFGSRFLKDNVPLKIEILDKSGETVYVQPVDYGQSKANKTSLTLPYRYVSVEVYRPPINVPGAAKLVILAELDPDEVNFEIPEQYRGRYNVKFSKTINIDSTEPINKSPILFYRRPKFTVQEIVKAQLIKPELITSEVSGTFVFGIATNEGDTYELPSDTSRSTTDAISGSTDQTSTYDSLSTTDTDNKSEERKFIELYKYKSGEQKVPSLLGKKGTLETRLSPQPPEFKVLAHSFTPAPPFSGSFTSKMVGGEIRIPKESIYVNHVENLGFENYSSGFQQSGFLSDFASSYVTWTDYTGSIEKVENNRVVHCREPFYVIYEPPSNTTPKQIRKASFGNPYVPANRAGLANFTASFQDIAAPSTSSYRFDSFVDLDLNNLRTFSGDIYRLRVSGKSQSEQSDFKVLLDTVIESPELLVDSNSSSGVLRTGYFQSQAHTDLYWTSSSNTNVSFNTDYLTDAIYISGSHKSHQDSLRVSSKTDQSFKLLKGVPYTLTFEAFGKQTDKADADGNLTKEGKLFFHISGSSLSGDNNLNINNSSDFGQTLTDLTNRKVGVDLDDGARDKFISLGRVSHTFVPKFLSNTQNKDTNVTFQIRANSGEWYISDVSIRAAQDTGFSPDTFSARIPIPNNTSRPDRYDFYIEYFNINNDSAQQTTLIEDVPIIGAPLILEGSDNMLTGSLFLGNLQGTGIEMQGGSAFIRAVGYQGFTSASTGQGGGFFMWSGSVAPGGETQDNYTGAGLEIHDGNTGINESFFKFRTIDADNDYSSSFDIKTSRFFLGQENSNFVSGALGNVEISSSNFHLTADGDVTMSGTITAEAGNLGDFSIIDGKISGSNITMDANNSTIFKTDQGPGSDSAPAGGLDKNRDEYYIDFTPETESPDNFYVKFGPNFMVDKDGILIASGATFIGTITASAGLIGGFTSDDDSFFTGGKSSPTFFISGSATGTGQTKSNLVISSSGFTVNSQGEISASAGRMGGWSISDDRFTGGNMTILSSGTIESNNFATNVPGSGFRLTAEDGGFLEVENARIRGTLSTAVFEKETVNAVGGQLYVANSTVLTGSVTNPGGIHSAAQTTMSVENVTGFTQGEILSIKKVSNTGFSTEYVLVNSSSRSDGGSETDLSGNLHVTRGYGNGTTGDSGSLGNAPTAAQAYSGSQVVVSTGKINTGYIRLNANPNDTSTPYMDIVERTGSGLYDVDLKVRLGDLSGLSAARLTEVSAPADPGFGLYTDNVFLKGAITATTGSIGGINMQSNKIFTGTGTHGGSTTGFFANSSGDFSLGSKFKFTNSSGELLVSGSNVKVETPSFFLGGTSQFVSGSNGILEISSSNFHLNNTGDVTMTGNITATTGQIGGFDISSNEISSSGMSMDSTNQVLIFKDVNGSTLGTAGQEALRISFDGSAVIPSGNTTTTGERARIHVPSGSLAASDLLINTETLNNVYVVPGRFRVFRKGGSGTPSDGNGKSLLNPSNLGNNFNKHLDAGGYFPNSNVDGAFSTMDFNCGVLGYASRGTNSSTSRQVALYGLSNVGAGAISIYGEVLQETGGYSGVFHGGQFVVGDVVGTGGSGADSTTDSDFVFVAYPNDIDGGTYSSYKGRVGINKRLPASALDVNGMIQTNTTISGIEGSEDSPSFAIGSFNDGFFHDGGIKFVVNDDAVFFMQDGGHFHADNDVTAFSTSVTSDKRLKEDIKPLQDNLNKILELKPSSFVWKIRDKQNDVGLIAQDVEKIIPEVVKENISIGKTKKFLDGDNHKTVDYSKITTYLIGAIQEQQKQIDELKKKLEEL